MNEPERIGFGVWSQAPAYPVPEMTLPRFLLEISRVRFGLRGEMRVNVYQWGAMKKHRGMSWNQVWGWIAQGNPTPPDWMYPNWATRGCCL